jgi:hypothetical protein
MIRSLWCCCWRCRLLWHWARRRPPALPTRRSSSSPHRRRRRARWRRLLPAVRVAAVALLIVALARPQFGARERGARRGNRHHARRRPVEQHAGRGLHSDGGAGQSPAGGQGGGAHIRRGARGDRIGLVLFAARPYLQSPLTLDHGWVMANLERAEIGMIEDGTAVGSALATAVNALEASDGGEQGGDPPHRRAEQRRPGHADSGGRGGGGARLPRLHHRRRDTRRRPLSRHSISLGNKRYVPMQVDIDDATCERSPRRPAAATSAPPTPRACAAFTPRSTSWRRREYEGLLYLDYHELYRGWRSRRCCCSVSRWCCRRRG